MMAKAYLLMVFVAMFYSGNILVGKAINDLPPITIAFFRLLLAFLIVAPFAYRQAYLTRETFYKLKWPFLLMTLSGVTFFNTFIYGALQFTSATNVAVLETVIPALTVILSALLIKERLPRIAIIGVVLSISAAMYVVVDGQIFSLHQLDWNPGDLIMIGAIICWSVYSMMVKQYMAFFKPYAALFVMTGLSVIVLLPIMMIEWSITGIPDLTFQLPMYGGLLYLGLFPSLIALLFFNEAVGTLGASRASVMLNLLPIFTMAGAAIWLGEAITIHHITGTMFVIIGVWLTTKKVKLLNNK